ncbi:TetR family transcriptional regulator [Jiangella muralis]|uniref:TetR family transcriptional regulator n=1 Tax=Jiangella muralis TaxID=702383 RepID=UPI00069D2FC0|nr:TetR family transcriptional regulator [Jiangella muralis]
MSTAAARGKTPTRQTRGKRTEQEILSAATWLLSERGFHGTGIRDIADAAQVAVSAMYYYAASKQQLLEQIMTDSLDILAASARKATADLEDPAAKLVTVIGTHVLFHTTNPRSARVTDQDFPALTGALRTRILARRDDYESVWRDIIEDGVRQGTFADRGSLARLALLQMTTGVAQWYRPRGGLTAEEVWQQFAVMSLAMLGSNRMVDDLEIPTAATLSALVQLSSEPRRRPPGLR